MPTHEYHVDVNKGSLNAGAFERMLNAQAGRGWRLHTIFEQHGNTVYVLERPVEVKP
jgi:hypothetical protein